VTSAPQSDWIGQKRLESSIVLSGKGASSAPDSGEARSTTAREPSKTVDARLGGRCAPDTPGPAWPYPRPGFSTEAVQTPARVNVTCVTPLGEEVASIS
jgi:hypothetical protein